MAEDPKEFRFWETFFLVMGGSGIVRMLDGQGALVADLITIVFLTVVLSIPVGGFYLVFIRPRRRS